MFMWIIIWSFSSFVVITTYAQPPAVLLENSSITSTDDAEEALAEIKTIEALPFVIFREKVGRKTYTLPIPEDITAAVAVNGKMVNGTKFTLTDSLNQIFLCPSQNMDEICLVPQKFEGFDRLQCAEEPTPDVIAEDMGIACSFNDHAILYNVIYDICNAETPHKYTKPEVELYNFCYSIEKQKTLYTTHYILSPKLLKSKLLHREQQLSYPYPDDSRFPNANIEEIVYALPQASCSSDIALKPIYWAQKLVPSEDMALGTWRKTTYQFFNVELQHRELFKIWNEINNKVRTDAIRMYEESGINFQVRTGVFEITTDASKGDEQIYNMWGKMIVAESKNEEELGGVVILMNNFLDSRTPNSKLQSIQTEIENYCHINLCKYDLKNSVENVGGRVKCCEMTKEIEELFGIRTTRILPVLPIRGLIKNRT